MARRNRVPDSELDPAPVPPRREERVLLDALDRIVGPRILCTSNGRAQTAAALAARSVDDVVHCHFLDLFQADAAKQSVDVEASNLTIACEADMPEGEIDSFVLPVYRNGEAELTRERLQEGYRRLRDGGHLWASTDNRRDEWLKFELLKLFVVVERESSSHGALYHGVKKKPLKRIRDLSCEFVFRDGPRLVKAYSRPGVFSHRKLDVGSRKLLNEMQIQDGDKVLDLGCGSGAIGVAAALRAENVQVHAVDSNARAVMCAAESARLNGIETLTTELSQGGLSSGKGTFTVAAGNPPYYSGYRIAQEFLETSHWALRSGGRLYLVTKTPDWFEENVPELFRDVRIIPAKEYFVVAARRP